MLKRLLDYNEGEEFDLVLMVKNSQLRQDKRGKHYLLMQLADSSGSIRANLIASARPNLFKGLFRQHPASGPITGRPRLRTPAASTPARWLRPQG